LFGKFIIFPFSLKQKQAWMGLVLRCSWVCLVGRPDDAKISVPGQAPTFPSPSTPVDLCFGRKKDEIHLIPVFATMLTPGLAQAFLERASQVLG
jgi:hypothetical protein